MTKDEALTMALEFLEAIGSNYWGNRKVVIAAIKEALAQEQWTPADMAYRPGGLAQPEQDQFKPDWNTEAVLVEEMQRMAKRIEELEIEREQVQYKYGPMSFQIYLPLYATPVVNNAKLPWVYDQDRSSGNVASMWVTPVARMGANGPRSAT